MNSINKLAAIVLPVGLLMTITACSGLDSLTAQKVSGEVIRVVDGDTVHVLVDGKDENVRLLLVDTPESVHPSQPTEPYGKESSNFAKKILTKGKKVELEFEEKKRGKYDRLLAYLWVDDKNFNQFLLENGWARYAYDYDPPYKYEDQFKKAQAQAKKHDRGIWSIDHYVTDDGFNLRISCQWAKAHHQSTNGCDPVRGN